MPTSPRRWRTRTRSERNATGGARRGSHPYVRALRRMKRPDLSRAELSSPEASSRRGRRGRSTGILRSCAASPVRCFLLARAMLAYIFLTDGWYQIMSYAAVGDYMASTACPGSAAARDPDPARRRDCSFSSASRPAGRRSRSWASACSTALFFHIGADQAIDFSKNIAMAGGFLALATFGPGPWSIDGWRGRAG